MFLYVAAIAAASGALRSARRGTALWGLCIALLALLAVEQQFGIFELVTDALRDKAFAEHWYGERRVMQREAVTGLGLAGLSVGLLLLVGARRQAWPLRVASFGTVGLLALALVKAVSLHGLDALFGRDVPGTPLTLGGGLELIGLAVVLLACLFATRSRARQSWTS